LKLDEPVSKLVPEFATLQLLDGYDAAGKPVVRPARTPVTLKHLLTHTSGLCYDTWSDDMQRYEKAGGAVPSGVAPLPPLMFEPGTRWQYGYGADWSGRLVEIVSGQTLEQYFQSNILQPLGMHDTSFIMPAEKFDRMVSRYDRQPDGSLKEEPRVLPAPPTAFNGGGGLYSTSADYIKFTQMILRRGRAADGRRGLHPKTVEQLSVNKIGPLGAGKLKTYTPDDREVDINRAPPRNGAWAQLTPLIAAPRDAAAWRGQELERFIGLIPNAICAVIMMQFLPFVDKGGGLAGRFRADGLRKR
jgi:CubicO group peptidase (beta-lactamase class C family)